MPAPTKFKVVDGKLVQSLRITPYAYRGANAAYTVDIPYEMTFEAVIRVKNISSYYKGSTYVEWESEQGNTYYSNIHDYKHTILNAVIEKGGWVKGTFRFMSRGGTNRSLVLSNVKINSEPTA